MAMHGVFSADSDTEDDVHRRRCRRDCGIQSGLGTGSRIKQDKLDRIAKRLWAEYPQKFNEKNADLGTFLNDFVELMNEFNVNFHHAKGLLRRHIDSKLKSHIKANEELVLPSSFRTKIENIVSLNVSISNLMEAIERLDIKDSDDQDSNISAMEEDVEEGTHMKWFTKKMQFMN